MLYTDAEFRIFGHFILIGTLAIRITTIDVIEQHPYEEAHTTDLILRLSSDRKYIFTFRNRHFRTVYNQIIAAVAVATPPSRYKATPH